MVTEASWASQQTAVRNDRGPRRTEEPEHGCRPLLFGSRGGAESAEDPPRAPRLRARLWLAPTVQALKEALPWLHAQDRLIFGRRQPSPSPPVTRNSTCSSPVRAHVDEHLRTNDISPISPVTYTAAPTAFSPKMLIPAPPVLSTLARCARSWSDKIRGKCPPNFCCAGFPILHAEGVRVLSNALGPQTH
jgi:hypothetical protein